MSLKTVVGAAGLVIGVLQCNPETPERVEPTPESCQHDCCMSDPNPRCLRLRGCRYDRDCPTGTTCVGTHAPKLECSNNTGGPEERMAGGDLPCCKGSDASTECQPVNELGSVENALMSGFDVGGFSLERTSDEMGAAAFQWRAPRNARAVVCALFGCTPDIREAPGVSNYRAFEIDNYDKCVLAARLVEAKDDDGDQLSRALDFGTVPPYVPASTCATGPAETRAASYLYTQRRPKLSALLVGCWAYDATRVIAATPLLPLTRNPGALGDGVVPKRSCIDHRGDSCVRETTPGFFAFGACDGRECNVDKPAPPLPLLVSSCTDPQGLTDGLNCFPSDVGGFGTCLAGGCRRRCVTAFDCDRTSSPSEACCRLSAPPTTDSTSPSSHDAGSPDADPPAMGTVTDTRRELVGSCIRPDALVQVVSGFATAPAVGATSGSNQSFAFGNVVCSLAPSTGAGGAGG